ncbi:unnamed protein product [Prorocentrum cordatum]|uniref:Protein ENHANCED DISEASE RESISTANCE 2 C-terminal domain-containing protein n=1 Tax=Prorocentrum cordatum TaxID=2364126 RepID=A0ABN9U6V6_9DINO|nr:unnamed protein product [Polarella glacialis]
MAPKRGRAAGAVAARKKPATAHTVGALCGTVSRALDAETGLPESVVLLLRSAVPSSLALLREERHSGRKGEVPTPTPQSHLLAVGRETPALRLWRRFVEAGESTRDLTFKAVGIVENLDTMRVPGIVEKFNAKPVAITKSARVLAQSLPEVLEIEFDVRQWAFLARHSFVSLRSLATKAVIQVGYLVEGKSDAELPEQILAHIRLHHADFTQAKSIPDL